MACLCEIALFFVVRCGVGWGGEEHGELLPPPPSLCGHRAGRSIPILSTSIPYSNPIEVDLRL